MFLLFFSFRRVRDKYESELKELEESERKMQEKYNSMKVGARSVAIHDRCVVLFKTPRQT